jgi:tetratricopeptide (TPR) repeat protein/transcriptional regulator with XRE-family HTH domain
MNRVRVSEPPGRWLRGQRVAAGLTQEDLAERSGVSVRTIADLERGRTRRPYPSSVRALIGALGLPDEAASELVARYRTAGNEPAPAPPAVPSPAIEAHEAHEPHEAHDAHEAHEAAAPRQLPTAVPHFAGRTSELRLLDAILGDADRGASGVVISAIGGTAGVGKTALALHWAHRVAPRFPDGQLYANLRGFDPSGSPAEPAGVLRGLLDALGVHPERFPADTEGLAALYRSLLADRKMLVLLDNAADVAQVRPLLPASPRCLVIVTSRRELSALAAREGARLLSLDVLPEQEAIELLTARLGTGRAHAEPDAITQLATLCARLPLALSVIVARAAAAPNLPLAALVAELTELRSRLDALDVGDPTANVRTVFSLSYRHLPKAAARMFRLLGLHPGPDISAPAAASLAGVPLPEARAALRDLARASLIIESLPGRYGFHDLLRAYAAEQAALREGGARRETIHRMLDHYLHTARRAHLVLYPGRQRIELGPPRALVAPEGFTGKPFALSWLRAEYQVLLKIVDLAAREGFDGHAWRLPVVLWTFFDVCGHWHDGSRIHRTAIEAARRCGDRGGQAHALRGLGTFDVMLGDYPHAHQCLAEAQEVFRRIGDMHGLARTDLIMGQAFEFQGRHREALGVVKEALRISETAPDDSYMQLVRASALNGSAWYNAHLGELGQARAHCTQAIELCRSIGYSPGEAGTWDTLGFVWQRLGDHAEAAACFLRAVALEREMGSRFNLAMALAHLGDTHVSTGEVGAARRVWAEALTILADLHHPEAFEVRAKLESLEPVAL